MTETVRAVPASAGFFGEGRLTHEQRIKKETTTGLTNSN